MNKVLQILFFAINISYAVVASELVCPNIGFYRCHYLKRLQECSDPQTQCERGMLCCNTPCGRKCVNGVKQPCDRVDCKINLCEYSTCAVRAAVCKQNSCGKCRAEWFLGDRRLSEAECEDFSPMPTCPEVNLLSSCPFFLRDQCNANTPCPSGRYCCNDGCRNRCKAQSNECRFVSIRRVFPIVCERSCASGCHPNEICCSKAGCGLVCLPKIESSPPAPTCPGPRTSFTCSKYRRDSCSANNSCPPDQYCCNDGCANVCKGVDPGCPNKPPTHFRISAPRIYRRTCNAGCGSNEMCCDEGHSDLVCLPRVKMCKTPRNCDIDLCLFSTCGIPGSICKTNKCESCNAEWFLDGIKLSRKQCRVATFCPNHIIKSCSGYRRCDPLSDNNECGGKSCCYSALCGGGICYA